MRIALFSSFSPESGASSVPLRAHLEHMLDLDVHWYYLASEPVQRAKSHWLGKPLSDVQLAADLAVGSTRAIRRIADQLEGDLFWVVGHFEGVSVAAELIDRGKSVHLTVHDDPICMFRRSRRYRLLAPLMACHFSKVIRSARSVDVISTKMRDAFRKKYSVESLPVYRYVPELPAVSGKPDTAMLLVGHIGSVYHPRPFEFFLRACEQYAARHKRALKIIRIGTSPELDAIAAESPGVFHHYGELAEREAIAVLARCDFLYAMYPDGARFECFRRTSMPMKLSTYIQAQRPIFAHTPPDSGLAEVVDKFRIGNLCSSDKVEAIIEAISKLVDHVIEPKNFETARQDLMSRQQIDRLRAALTLQS